MSDWLICYLGMTAAAVLVGVICHYVDGNNSRLMGEALRAAIGLDPVKVYRPIPKWIQWCIATPVILVWALIGLFMWSVEAAEAVIQACAYLALIVVPAAFWFWVIHKVRRRLGGKRDGLEYLSPREMVDYCKSVKERLGDKRDTRMDCR